MSNHTSLPTDLPAPVDNGECDHLVGMELPSVALPATSRGDIDPSKCASRYVVIYCYPKTGHPDGSLPAPGWDAIPGARGCTPQTCGFRDLHDDIVGYDATVFGLSVNDPEYQKEAAERLEIPFAFLSDANFEFTTALHLPTFDVADMTLLKRVTIIAEHNVIQKIFYPVFPTNENAGNVLAWLEENQ